MDDPVIPRLEQGRRRRLRRKLFRQRQVPVRMLVPNLFTLIGLAAGLTAIRLAIEGRYELALAAIIFAALLDGVDGRIARMLKASSRFGAELDSLADFVNFGVAPAILLFTWEQWGTTQLRGLGWIVVLLFAIACGLRLARFNSMLDEERPRWQSNYFTGVPAPAGALVVLLPVYVDSLGLVGLKHGLSAYFVLTYTLLIAFLMVSTIPTFSGKLAGERISRELVLPAFFAACGLLALLVTYPYATMTAATLLYLAFIPVSVSRFRKHMQEMGSSHPATAATPTGTTSATGSDATPAGSPGASDQPAAKPSASSAPGAAGIDDNQAPRTRH